MRLFRLSTSWQNLLRAEQPVQASSSAEPPQASSSEEFEEDSDGSNHTPLTPPQTPPRYPSTGEADDDADNGDHLRMNWDFSWRGPFATRRASMRGSTSRLNVRATLHARRVAELAWASTAWHDPKMWEHKYGEERPDLPTAPLGRGHDSPGAGTNGCCPALRAAGLRFVSSLAFQSFMAVVILLNAVVIGYETDKPELGIWELGEKLFLAIFLFELVMKLTFQGIEIYFGRGPDFYWNIFDCCIVGLGVLDTLLSSIGVIGTGFGATIFRIVRLFRILRLFRLVKFLRQLYILAFGFALAAEAVLWVTLLMTFIVYIFSIILTRTFRSERAEDWLDKDLVFTVEEKFGSMCESMWTLFELIASPNLLEFQHLVWAIPSICFFLVGFVLFGSFGMIALLTGVTTESMFQKNSARKDEERGFMRHRRMQLGRQCATYFNDLELDEHGEATCNDVLHLLPRVAETFEDNWLDFDKDALSRMIYIIDADASGKISRAEFESFMDQLARGVQPLLIMELLTHAEKVRARLGEVEQIASERLKTLRSNQSVYLEQLKTAGKHAEDLGERVEGLSERVLTLCGHAEEAYGGASLRVQSPPLQTSAAMPRSWVKPWVLSAATTPTINGCGAISAFRLSAQRFRVSLRIRLRPCLGRSAQMQRSVLLLIWHALNHHPLAELDT